MFLALDVGNSETSFGLFSPQGKLTHHWRFQTKASLTADEIASFFLPLAEHASVSGTWSGIALCSVVPSVNRAFITFCEGYLKATPFTIDWRLPLEFRLNVEEAHCVGADRIANAAYGFYRLERPAIIIDCGTATTFDVISRDGNYEGGVILPGIRLLAESLNVKTAQLPTVGFQFPDSVIGRTTISCIQSGILYGQCDLIDGLIHRIEEELGSPCKIVLTGGLGYLFETKLKKRVSFEANLTLEGIRLLWNRRS